MQAVQFIPPNVYSHHPNNLMKYIKDYVNVVPHLLPQKLPSLYVDFLPQELRHELLHFYLDARKKEYFE